ncbi:Mini-chromosome maintenance complex-binding protein [Hypsizygus marmoreus]|uniref:Mini-chromosome maintenance complex-binding protein n=1 Tax=Hypsizygus marmoreus TaxID=39966 RepID=A0A369JH31_HYPMA|nr:Mini-chromosome maintenance complex-binding protein [Hypsizygus marmoreus]
MVSALVPDALADPDAVLQDLDGVPARVTDHFKSIFASDDAFNEIPPLTLDHPPEVHKDRSLVRFRAMIQDTSPSPEIYLAKRSGGRCGGWGLGDDATTQADNIDYANLKECTVFWAVSVPGESPWTAPVADLPPNRATHRPPHPHKYPVPGAPHVGVQVKIYDAGDSLRSTDVVTFVGILTSEPIQADLELATPSLVPTLHVLFFQPVPPTIVPRVYPSPSATPELRDELITWIADEALAGDRDAAEWVLLCAIARVQSRTPPILPLTLTLSHFPSPGAGQTTIPALTHVLAQIFPLVSTLPISLHTLNDTSFAPESKNEDLHSGWLQLPAGSVCVVTEGGVTEGGVFERGLANLRAVQEAMNAQTLEYVFPFSRFAFETDIAFVVLSEGRKSTFFQINANVPLRPTTPDFEFYKSADSGVRIPGREKLEAFRALVGGAKIGSVSIGETTAEFIQDDFVNERKAAQGLTSDDLIHRMMVARLLALSLQEKEITVEVWEKTKALEGRRKARLG